MKTVASRLDQEWLCEFFLLMICFFLFINCVFILAVAADAPQIIYIVLRVFGGTCVALISHVNKGCYLYDELTLEELSDGRDSELLYFMRIFFLVVCFGFTIYLLTSCICLCTLGGFDGNNIRNVRNPNKMFKRIPFGNLVFQEGLDCAICMEHFEENHKVVQLSCFESHVFHRSCITGWVRSGHSDCPLCR